MKAGKNMRSHRDLDVDLEERAKWARGTTLYEIEEEEEEEDKERGNHYPPPFRLSGPSESMSLSCVSTPNPPLLRRRKGGRRVRSRSEATTAEEGVGSGGERERRTRSRDGDREAGRSTPNEIWDHLPAGSTAMKDSMEQALYHAAANTFFLLFGLTLYYNYLLLSVYVTPMLWALLCSIALRRSKNTLYSTIMSCVAPSQSFDPPRSQGALFPGPLPFYWATVRQMVSKLGKLYASGLKYLGEKVNNWVKKRRKANRRALPRSPVSRPVKGNLRQHRSFDAPISHEMKQANSGPRITMFLYDMVFYFRQFIFLLCEIPGRIFEGIQRNKDHIQSSGAYFFLLWFSYFLYFCYHLVLPLWYHILSVAVVGFSGAFLLATAWVFVVVSYALMHRQPPENVVKLLLSFTWEPIVFVLKWIDHKLFCIFSTCLLAIVSFLSRIYNFVLEGFKSFVRQNVHSIVATVLLVGVLFGVVLCGSFFAIQCFVEAQEAVVSVRALAEDAIDYSDWDLIDQETLHHQVDGFLHDSLEYAKISWGISPETNKALFTVHDFYKKYLNSSVIANVTANPELEEKALNVYNMTKEMKFFDPDFWQSIMDLATHIAPNVESYLPEFSSEEDGGVSVMKVAGNTLHYVGHGSRLVFGSSTSLVTLLLQTFGMTILSLFSFGFSFILFLTCLFYLLTMENDVLKRLSQMLPVGNSPDSDIRRNDFEKAFNDAITGVMETTFKIAVFHASLTWLSFRIADVPFAYLASFATASFAILPLIPSWVVALAAAVHLWNKGELITCISLFATHYFAYFVVNSTMYSEIPHAPHAYLVGLSLVSGLYVFELEGIVLGPMLLTVPVILYNLYTAFLSGTTSGSDHSSPHHPRKKRKKG
eukprot:CAMPEP_0119156060 /NCGR_PEP_ID=MMETSP1310-20130426/52065_1 /TAXON_ID=464262 /ORGANISM="Genus nov. species nov., Strain RCC2339" /LENGTH=874 /DNA_ID=CAMNT_0007148669 /DNA_START=133 /DNA_END=2757 /DNA_ORIENTATION=+